LEIPNVPMIWFRLCILRLYPHGRGRPFKSRLNTSSESHIVEMNHSARFWRLVNRLAPGHERAKAWLDTHGADLHRYGLPETPKSPA